MKLDEYTRIPIGIAISVIGGGAAWMTSLAIQTQANAKSLELIEQRQIEYNHSINRIETDLAIIRTKTEIINKKLR
jgi:hypothetical protein